MDARTMREAGAALLAPARWIDAHPWASALAVAAIRLATTLPGLGRRAFWLDEVWTAALAVQPVGTIVSVGLHDENPPLYNLLTAAWVPLAGLSEVSLRLPSVLAGAAAAALLLLVVRRNFGGEAALWATLLLLANPLEWHWAREARAYGLVQLLCVASFGLFFRLFERPRRATAVALGAVEAVSLATHYAMGFAFAAQGAAALLARRSSPRGLRAWFGAQLLAVVAVAPFVHSLLRAMPKKAESWRPVPGGRDVLELATRLAGRRAALAWGLALVAAWVALRLAGRTAAPRRIEASGPTRPGDDWRIAALALWAMLPVAIAFAVSQRAPMFLSRYLLFCALGWVALLGTVASRLPLPPAGRGLVAAALAVLAAGGFGKLVESDDWRNAAGVAMQARSDGALRTIVVTAQTEDCMVWAWHAQRDVLPTVFRTGGATRFAPGDLERNLAAAGSTCLRASDFEKHAADLPAKALLFAATPDAAVNDAAVDLARSAGFLARPLPVPGAFRAAVIERVGATPGENRDPAPGERSPPPAGAAGR